MAKRLLFFYSSEHVSCRTSLYRMWPAGVAMHCRLWNTNLAPQHWGAASPSKAQTGNLHTDIWTLLYLVCRHQVDQHCVQQLLRNSVSFTDDGAHQIHHMHVHLLVMAIASKVRRASFNNDAHRCVEQPKLINQAFFTVFYRFFLNVWMNLR